jgi:hypothetical protein
VIRFNNSGTASAKTAFYVFGNMSEVGCNAANNVTDLDSVSDRTENVVIRRKTLDKDIADTFFKYHGM